MHIGCCQVTIRSKTEKRQNLNWQRTSSLKWVWFCDRILDHLITWSLDHLITWSLDHSITRSLDHSITRSLDHSITEASRNRGCPSTFQLSNLLAIVIYLPELLMLELFFTNFEFISFLLAFIFLCIYLFSLPTMNLNSTITWSKVLTSN
jgi:hypothetical protein